MGARASPDGSAPGSGVPDGRGRGAGGGGGEGREATMQALERASLAKRAYDALRASLMEGEFKPGEPLRLRVLSTRLGTSQTPIREALMQLVAERVLTGAPGRSPRVPELTLGRFLELRDIRVALESLAARKAARRATPALIRTLQEQHERLVRAKEAQRFKETLAANRDFHFTLHRASEQETLVWIIESLWVQTGPYLNFLYPGGVPAAPRRHPHEEVLRGLEEGDPERTAAAIEQDIVEGGAPILSYLKD